MAKISKIKLPNNSEYDIYDPDAAHGTYAGSSTDGGPATTAKKLFGQDTRLANSPPSFYLTSGQNSTLIMEFKSRGVIDAPGTSGFGTLMTITPWYDNTGGLPVQIYVDNTGQRAIRFAQTDATWGSWSTLALTSDIPSVGNGTIKLQRNGVDVLSFTTNQNGNTTGNLIVPTKVSELTNDSGYLNTAGTGLRSNGTTILTNVKRLNGGDLNYKPGINRFELQEVNSTTGNIPSTQWYHVLTSEGSDSNYEVQLALSMTGVPAAYYRRLSENVYSEWYRLSKALLQKYETGTITNNTWYRLFAIKYTQYNYLHLRVLVKAGYLNSYEAFICVRYTPSGLNGNATSIKVISTYNELTNADSKSLVLYKFDDNTIALAAKAYGQSSTLGFEILDITCEANAIKPESVIVNDSFTALSGEPTKFGIHYYLTGSYDDLTNKPTITTYTFATGDSNGQIKVTPSGGSAQNVSVKGLGSAAYTNSGTYATQTTLTNQNLNSLTVAGFYNAGGGNTVTNKPSGVDAFGLEVVHTAGGTDYVQILYKNGEVIPYRRYCNNGTWTSWVKDESVVYTSSVNAVVGDTTCTISDSSITTTSLIEPFSSNSTGDTIAIKNIAVTAGQAVLTFKALTVDTSFRLRVTNV